MERGRAIDEAYQGRGWRNRVGCRLRPIREACHPVCGFVND